MPKFKNIILSTLIDKKVKTWILIFLIKKIRAVRQNILQRQGLSPKSSHRVLQIALAFKNLKNK